ncbi:DUF192 domain-containing protein [Lichenihabitans psoromatis]|uniref:DUF192 domain-containing protein n=1 Tax=Lichenihabitans psoromatis TaxID=2528642 RepID=UPI001038376F|nr:DUF192 domain-containing protein [Lichenihabitans psoromatis]
MRMIAVACLLAGSAVGAAAQNKTLEPLSIVTASGSHPFEVEVMRTDPERERGLMERRYLPPNRGMLFDFKTPQPVMMWMKNTYIPLDMVFIDKQGRVVSTTENAEPMSERIISSKGVTLGVLEVNAGVIAKIGVKIGDKVENAMFPK